MSDCADDLMLICSECGESYFRWELKSKMCEECYEKLCAEES